MPMSEFWKIGFLAMICVVATRSTLAEDVDPAGIEFFEKHIRPVFAEHCWPCHSDDAKKANKLKGGLRLDSEVGIRSGGDSGPMFVSGKPAESLLIKALTHQELQMPPESKLSDQVIANFHEWVKLGAPMPTVEGVETLSKEVDWLEARKAWAFRIPVEHPLPAVKNTTWPTSAIDSFVLAEMENQGLNPVRAAGKEELIRRATFDLTGLPPSPDDINNFLQDESPEAFTTVVDRLLQSPHYGERWARYWLDLARYADDQGNSFLSPTPKAYLYRDWVVRALNNDMPYDEFIRLQIAGDELDDSTDDYEVRLAGLGFQGLGPQFRKGAAGEAKAKADELEDRVDTLSRGILGLTVSCARCHDHKFDPIPTRDYYSLAAAYNGATWSDRMIASPESISRLHEWEKQVEQHKAELEKWLAEQGRQTGRRAIEKIDQYLLAAWRIRSSLKQQLPVDDAVILKSDGLDRYFIDRLMKRLETVPDGDLFHAWRRVADEAGVAEYAPEGLKQQTQAVKDSITTALRELESKTPIGAEEETLLKSLLLDGAAPFFVSGQDVQALFNPEQQTEQQAHQTVLNQLTSEPPPRGPMMPSVSGGGVPLQVFVRGNPLQLGEPAPPGFLRILGGQDKETAGTQFTRRDLANAIASPQNPLTARVLVNRVWHYHFGRGIVATLGNFGKQGSPPTHPELLDTLAARFIKSGWSIKSLHREMMLSSVYRLSSAHHPGNEAIDPDNIYLWRATPRRLEFESWRDALLAVAGKLDPTVGGPSLDQTTPAVKEVPGADFFTRLVGLELDNPNNGRRTLYCIVSRYSPNPTAGLFDFPEPNVASDLRNVTTIPQQQLFVLNSAFTIEMGKAFAKRLTRLAEDDENRIQQAWKLAYGRPPTNAEIQLSVEFLRIGESAEAGDNLSRLEQLCHAIFSSNEFTFIP